jgi:hypothetical protein
MLGGVLDLYLCLIGVRGERAVGVVAGSKKGYREHQGKHK